MISQLRVLNNKIVNDISFYISVIVVLLIVIFIIISFVANEGISLDLIYKVYCDNSDDVIVSDSKNSNIDVEKDDNSYHFCISKNLLRKVLSQF